MFREFLNEPSGLSKMKLFHANTFAAKQIETFSKSLYFSSTHFNLQTPKCGQVSSYLFCGKCTQPSIKHFQALQLLDELYPIEESSCISSGNRKRLKIQSGSSAEF